MVRTKARSGTLGVVLASMLALSACGSSKAAGDGADPSEEQAQALAFAQCMRDNGIDMPDPSPGQEGFMTALRDAQGNHGQTTPDEGYEEAYAACEDQLPEFATEEHGEPDDEAMLALADCLRDQGLDVPDDLYSGGGMHDIDPEELEAAMEKCREVAGH